MERFIKYVPYIPNVVFIVSVVTILVYGLKALKAENKGKSESAKLIFTALGLISSIMFSQIWTNYDIKKQIISINNSRNKDGIIINGEVSGNLAFNNISFVDSADVTDNSIDDDEEYENNQNYIKDGEIPSDEITDWVVDNRNDVFYYDQAFGVSYEVRNVSKQEIEFSKYVYAEVGDVLQYQVEYDNTSDYIAENVIVKTWLPENVRYLEGTTKLYNSTNPEGIVSIDDSIMQDGINIGGYNLNANAYVRFKVEVVDNTLVEGTNRVVNWIGVQTNYGEILKNADFYVKK